MKKLKFSIFKKKEKEEKGPVKKKKISNLYKLMLGAAILIFTIISFICLGTLITAAMLFILALILFFTIVLDIYPRNSKMRKITKSIFILFIILGIIAICIFIVFFGYIVVKSPEFNVSNLERGETTIVYDSNNEIYATLGDEKREKVTYDELPEVLIDALIATEDSRFFQHNGFDAARFLKASIGQITGGGGGGASTLTMQVSKNNFTNNDVSITRKFTDIYLSVFKIEKAFTKQEIIEFYVNNTFLGQNSWGVEQASQTYFGKSVTQLNLAEASLIAGLFQAPSDYNPFYNIDSAEERRDTVLSLMVTHGYITEEEKTTAQKISIADLLQPINNVQTNEFQGYVDEVVTEIEEKYGINPYYTSLEIYTNMNREKQLALNKVFDGETYEWPDDSIQGGVVAIESNTGKVIAIGAGRNRSGERTYSYATDIKRQIGSTAKPLFDYGPGIEYNNWSTGTIFDDSPHTYSGGGSIKNYDNAFKGKITLRYALQDSRNVPAVIAFQSVENSKIYDFVTTLGITPEVAEGDTFLHEAHALGAFNGTSPYQLAGAYAAFSNGGSYYEPYTVNKIVFRASGDEITNTAEKVTAMSDSTAYMITDVLRGVSNETGVANLVSGDIAMKTGTTNYDDETLKAMGYPSSSAPDGWIAGYTPEIVMAMWTGYVKNEPGLYLSQNRMVSHRNNLYKACVKAVMNDQTARFTQPSSVISVTIERGSDPLALASATTPDNLKLTELFKKGTEPTEVSKAYVVFENVTGLDVDYIGGVAKLTWNAVPAPTTTPDASLGTFGYKVYLNDVLLGFTESNHFDYTTTSPYGTYKVITCYSISGSNASLGSTITLSHNIVFTSTIANQTLTAGSTYNDTADKARITVTKNSTNVTSSAVITSDTSSVITNPLTPGTYTITFTATFEGESKTFTKVITVP